jgi:hypothetical protein
LIAVALRLSRRFRKILRMAFDIHEDDAMITASNYYSRVKVINTYTVNVVYYKIIRHEICFISDVKMALMLGD